jgi:hypothetical protein
MGWNDHLMVGPGYEDLYDSPAEMQAVIDAHLNRARKERVVNHYMVKVRAEIAEIEASYAGKESFTCRYCGQEFPMFRRVHQACQFCAEVEYS